jgi:hypothetical protein
VFANIQGSFQRVFHRDVEPKRHTGGNELDRKEKQKDGGNQGKAGKGHDKFRAQLGSQDLSLAVIKKFYDISEDKEDQQQQHKHVDVDEDQHDDRVGNGKPRSKTEDPGPSIRNKDNHYDQDQYNDPFTLAAPEFFF